MRLVTELVRSLGCKLTRIIPIDRVSKERVPNATFPFLASRSVERRYHLGIYEVRRQRASQHASSEHALEEAAPVDGELRIQCVGDLVDLNVEVESG